MAEKYLIPAGELVFEEEIKASRFITLLDHCDSEAKLKSVLTDVKMRYPGASHYCWAYVAAAPDNSVAMGSSDDGEPAGSAGRPMLATLQGSGLGEVMAIVVRYYGGTKLGVGGLVRAYTSGIKKALTTLETRLKELKYPSSLRCDYAQLADIEYLLGKYGADISRRDFSGAVNLEFVLAKDKLTPLNQDLATLSAGQIQVAFTETE
ncbi:YigZ family protein [Shewanella sp. FJAT-52076]|uniref:YigZ family protein n=1 Tax=Shewanella sp. FJAT-52076 TaxID=2864202 RepID=UPI001C656F0B|nr:YigZ family protein [Shewanella sp. FJAT-52076]QYJ75458.1 YigZ family protein [Shewanella sp. FJAT-52076]